MLIYNCVSPNNTPTWTQYAKHMNILHENYIKRLYNYKIKNILNTNLLLLKIQISYNFV